MSGTTFNPESRALFNQLINSNSNALVLKDGEIKGDGGMAFRSGLHRVFGQEKSTDDVKVNQNTMRFLLNHIAGNVTNSEMTLIMNQRIRLGGDKENYTVQDRLDRGTYISSELVGQLRLAVNRALTETRGEDPSKWGNVNAPQVDPPQVDPGHVDQPNVNEIDGEQMHQPEVQNGAGGQDVPQQQNGVPREEIGVINPSTLMTQSERDLVARRNASGVEYAFGGARHPEARVSNEAHWRSGGTVVDRALTKFGDEEHSRPTTFQKAINELYAKGRSGNDPQTRTWEMFREFWTRDSTPESEWTTELPPEDQLHHDLISSFRDEVEAKVQEFTDRGIQVTQDQVKDMLKECLGRPEQMQKFEKWAMKEEVEIAQQIAGGIKGVNEKLVRSIGPQGLSEAIGHWIAANPQFEAQGKALMKELEHAGDLIGKLGLTPLEGDWTARMIDQSGGTGHPLQLTQQLRQALQTAYDANPSGTELTTETLSRLLGDTLGKLVTEREAGKLAPEVETKLHEDLEDLYPALNEMRGQLGSTGGSVTGVAGGLLYQRMGEILLGRAIEKAKGENKDLSLPQIQNEITTSVRQTLERHREMQARLLPVLDQHVALRDEIDALRDGDGGLAGVPRERLRELDLKYDEVVRQSEELDAYCKQLTDELGDDPILKDVTGSLSEGTTMVLIESHNYASDSNRMDREYVARVEQQLGGMGLHDDLPPSLDGVSPGLNREIAMFNGLRSFVFDLASEHENFDRFESLSQLFRTTLFEPTLEHVKQGVYDNNRFTPNFLLGDRVKEAQRKFEEQWLDTIETRYPRLEEFRPVPLPPTPPMTVESTETYRQSLTSYVETTKGVREQLQTLRDGFGELGQTEAYAMQEAMRNVDSYVRRAEQALQILQR